MVDEILIPRPPAPPEKADAERSSSAPPPSGPTAVIDALPASTAERTVVRPPRAAPPAGFRAPLEGGPDSSEIPTPRDGHDPWTAEFTDGDMEGPTVATTETPAVLVAPRAPTPTPARPEPVRPRPKFEEKDIKRTMRLDRPMLEPARDPTRAAPVPPVRPPHHAYAATVPIAPSRSGEHPLPPHPASHAASWLPPQALQAPRMLAPPVKPQAIRIAEIGLAALVVITLSIGGCILLRNR